MHTVNAHIITLSYLQCQARAAGSPEEACRDVVGPFSIGYRS